MKKLQNNFKNVKKKSELYNRQKMREKKICRGRNKIEKEREKERTATTNYFLLNSLAGYDSLVAYDACSCDPSY